MSYSFFQASFPSVKSFAYFKNVQCIMHISFLFKETVVSVFEDLNAWKIIEEEMWATAPLGIFWFAQNFHSCNQFPDELGRGRRRVEREFLLRPSQAVSQWSWDQLPSIFPRLSDFPGLVHRPPFAQPVSPPSPPAASTAGSQCHLAVMEENHGRGSHCTSWG